MTVPNSAMAVGPAVLSSSVFGQGQRAPGLTGHRKESGVGAGGGADPGTHAHARTHTPPGRTPPRALLGPGWSSAPACWLVVSPRPGRPRSQFAQHPPLQPDAGGTGQAAPEAMSSVPFLPAGPALGACSPTPATSVLWHVRCASQGCSGPRGPIS